MTPLKQFSEFASIDIGILHNALENFGVQNGIAVKRYGGSFAFGVFINLVATALARKTKSEFF